MFLKKIKVKLILIYQISFIGLTVGKVKLFFNFTTNTNLTQFTLLPFPFPRQSAAIANAFDLPTALP